MIILIKNVTSSLCFQVGDVELNGYDARGFVVRRGETKLRYNELGQLSSAAESDRFTASYRYDSRGRLVAIHDGRGSTLQLLYTDPMRPDLVTHLHFPSDGRTFKYLYNEKGILVAIETLELRYVIFYLLHLNKNYWCFPDFRT